MSTNYIAPIWRMPENANNTPINKLSNYSMDFDAGTSSQAIECGKGSNVDITGPISISVWFNSTATDGARGIVCKNESQASQNFAQYFFDQLSGELRWRAGKTTVTYAINADQWYHAVGVYDGSNVSLYVDGTQVVAPTAAQSTSYQSNEPMYIGRRLGQNYFGGQISQVCIFDYALTDGTGGTKNQIEYLYNLNNPMAITGGEPVAYWPLGDNSNPNANAGYPNISTGADSVFEFTKTSGELIDLGKDDWFSEYSNQITFSLWINKTNWSSTGFESIISKYGSSGASQQYRIAYPGSANQLQFIIQGGPSGGPYSARINTVTLTSAQTNSDWLHILWRHNASTSTSQAIFNGDHANAVSLTNISANPYAQPQTTISNLIGNISSGAQPFEGAISNYQIFNSYLDNTAVEALYNNGQPLTTGAQPQSGNLKGWWKLNQSANWEADTAGNWQIPDAVSSYPQSFSFDGIDDKINLIKPSGWDDTQVHCVSLWIKNEDSNTGYIINSRGGGSATPGFSFIVNGTSTGYIFSNTVTSKIATGYQSDLKIPNDGKWHHVLWTHQPATNILKAYINGIYKYTHTGSAGTDSTSSIGPIVGNSGGAPWKGKISNIMAWEQIVLTDGNVAIGESAEDQVAEVYNNGVPLKSASVATSNLKLWAKLDNTEIFDGAEWEVQNQKYPANYKNALNFPNTAGNKWIDVADKDTPIIDFSQPWAVSWWTKFDNTSMNLDCFWQFGATPASGSTERVIIAWVSPAGNKLAWTVGDNWTNPNCFYNVGPDINDGKWHHIVFTGDGTNEDIKIWVDNETVDPLAGAVTVSLSALTVDPTNDLGRGYITNRYLVDTDMSNVAVFDKQFTGAEVTTLYNNGTPETNISESPVSWWKLNNLTTGIEDSAGNNNGTNNGAVEVNTFVSTQAGASTDMEGQSLVNNNVSTLNGESSSMTSANLVKSNLTRKQPYSNYSMNFDSASADYIEVTDPGEAILAYGENKFSFSGWINPKTFENQGGLITRHVDSIRRTTLKLTYQNGFDGVMFQSIDSPSAPNFHIVWDNILTGQVWQHVCFVYDGAAASCKIYINGEDQGAGVITGSIPSSLPNFNGNPLYIAVDAMNGLSNRNFNGQFSNFCVFDRVLSESEILKIYNNGITQDLQKTSSFSNDISAWWPMDENSSYYNGTDWIVREVENGNDGQGANTGNVNDMVGSAPGSESNGVGSNLTIEDLKGDMSNSNKNAYSINMADYADSVTNPASSGISKEVPSV